MSRFGSLGQQYFDNSGQPLSGGRIYFYESGSSTEKDTYSDADQTVLNTNPVILDGSGRQPDIFFSGSAKAVLKDSNDAQIEETDPVGSATARDAFADWNGLITYEAEDIVQGSDGEYYISIAANNLNNDPTTEADKWEQMRFLSNWNSAKTYSAGDLVIASDNALYRCINGNSLNDNPTSTPAEWSQLGVSGWSSLVEDTSPQLGGNLDVNGFTVDGRTPSVDGERLDLMIQEIIARPEWNYASPGGAEPASVTWSNESFVLRATFTWGTAGGEDGNPTAIVWAWSTNSGGSFSEIGTETIAYDEDGYPTSTTWD
jgi:hypothetical protein